MAFEENLQNYLLINNKFSTVSIQSLYECPLNIEEFKDFKSFKNIIDCALRKPLPDNYVSADFKNLNEVCLDIASKNGLTKFVKILLREGAKVNRVNNTFNRAPIHFATEGGHVDTLEALLAEPTVNPNLSVGQQTALDIAVNNKNQKCVSLLLQNCHIYDLKYYLKINDETNFLKNMLNDEKTLSVMDMKELLKIATQNDLCEAVKGILDWLKGKNKYSKKCVVEPAASLAIENGRHAILRELLNVVPDIANNLILDACRQLKKLRNQTIDARPHISNWLKCMELLLNQEEVDINKLIDDESNTPLHYAAKSGCREAVTLFLNRGSYIGHMNKFNHLSHTSRRTPYQAILMIMNDLGSRELEVFMYIAHNSKLKNLLKHPLLSSFLYLKRHMIRHILWMNFIVYVPFYLLLNYYILRITAYNSSPNENKTQLVNISLENSFAQIIPDQEDIIRYVIIIFLIMLIVLTIVFLCGADLWIGITVILLSSWEFIILISRWPMFSISIMIFRTVFYNFVRLFLPYVFLIVPFALVFHIFFKDSGDPNFSNPVFSIFKTIVMLTGEFNIDDISFTSHTVWNRIVFVMFVFLMVIVLMNMLNGLAVSDTAEILSKAELIGLIYQIELITYFENIVYAIGDSIRCWPFKISLLRKFFGSLASINIFLFPQYLKDGTISFKINDSLDFHDNSVSSYNKSKKKNKTIFKMDNNILKQAKQIFFNKNQLSDNDRIMIALNKLQKALGITSDETEVLD